MAALSAGDGPFGPGFALDSVENKFSVLPSNQVAVKPKDSRWADDDGDLRDSLDANEHGAHRQDQPINCTKVRCSCSASLEDDELLPEGEVLCEAGLDTVGPQCPEESGENDHHDVEHPRHQC